MAAELVGISLTVTLVFFIISLAVVVFSADKFIDYSSVLAGRLGVSEFIIGLTLIAFGTSIPEIFVGVQAVQNQAENLAAKPSMTDLSLDSVSSERAFSVLMVESTSLSFERTCLSNSC